MKYPILIGILCLSIINNVWAKSAAFGQVFLETTNNELKRTSSDVSHVNANESLDYYIQSTSTFGVRSEILQSPWYSMEPTTLNRFGLGKKPADLIKEKIIADMQVKLQMENKKLIESSLEFSIAETCEAMQDYEKSRIVQIDSQTSAGDSQSAVAGYGMAAASGQSWYNNSYSYREKIERDIYCVRNRVYGRATLRLTSQTLNVSPEAKSVYVRKHAEVTVEGLNSSLKGFLEGLVQIERSPVVNETQLAKFKVSSGDELSSWMSFNLGALRTSIRYLQIMQSVRLGFDFNRLADSLNENLKQVIRKLMQFESPGIFIVVANYQQGTEPEVIQIFDQNQLLEVISEFGFRLPQNPSIRIRNFSLAKDKTFVRAVGNSIECNNNFRKISSSPIIHTSNRSVRATLDKTSIAAKIIAKCPQNYRLTDGEGGSNLYAEALQSRFEIHRSSNCIPYSVRYSDTSYICQTKVQ